MPASYPYGIDRVAAHIPANLAGDLTLDALAEVAALSRLHFHRAYTAMTGLRPSSGRNPPTDRPSRPVATARPTRLPRTF